MSALTSKAGRIVAILGLVGGLGACADSPLADDPTALYVQRIPTVSTTAGNSQAANLAIQEVTPWPRHVNDTRIPGDATRMAAAVRKYECGAAVTIGSQTNSTQTSGGSTSSTTPLTADGCK